MSEITIESDASRILDELQSLKEEKSRIEQRISLLETQLRQRQRQRDIHVQNDAATNGTNGLAPDMIYRYSRHLLLPSFGVQGPSFVFSDF